MVIGDNFVSEMCLQQGAAPTLLGKPGKPGFTYSVCGSFTKNKVRIQKIKETADTRYIYQSNLEKNYFQHDLTYGDWKV